MEAEKVSFHNSAISGEMKWECVGSALLLEPSINAGSAGAFHSARKIWEHVFCSRNKWMLLMEMGFFSAIHGIV